MLINYFNRASFQAWLPVLGQYWGNTRTVTAASTWRTVKPIMRHEWYWICLNIDNKIWHNTDHACYPRTSSQYRAKVGTESRTGMIISTLSRQWFRIEWILALVRSSVLAVLAPVSTQNWAGLLFVHGIQV